MGMKRTHAGAGFLDGLLEWLGTNDAEKLVPAIVLLCRIGPPVVEFLIAEAAKPSTTPVHACRLLALAIEIGGKRGPAENRHLRLLRQHWCGAIRTRARQAMETLTSRRSRTPGRVSVRQAMARVQRARPNLAIGRGPLARAPGRPKPTMPAGVAHLP